MLCQGPYEASVRYRDFMGWDVPWYSSQGSAEELLAGRQVGMFHLVCYVRQGDRVFETYWTNGRGVEATATGCWTSPCTAGRNPGRTPRPAGRRLGGSTTDTSTESTGVRSPNGIGWRREIPTT